MEKLVKANYLASALFEDVRNKFVTMKANYEKLKKEGSNQKLYAQHIKKLETKYQKIVDSLEQESQSLQKDNRILKNRIRKMLEENEHIDENIQDLMDELHAKTTLIEKLQRKNRPNPQRGAKTPQRSLVQYVEDIANQNELTPREIVRLMVAKDISEAMTIFERIQMEEKRRRTQQKRNLYEAEDDDKDDRDDDKDDDSDDDRDDDEDDDRDDDDRDDDDDDKDDEKSENRRRTRHSESMLSEGEKATPLQIPSGWR